MFSKSADRGKKVVKAYTERGRCDVYVKLHIDDNYVASLIFGWIATSSQVSKFSPILNRLVKGNIYSLERKSTGIQSIDARLTELRGKVNSDHIERRPAILIACASQRCSHCGADETQPLYAHSLQRNSGYTCSVHQTYPCAPRCAGLQIGIQKYCKGGMCFEQFNTEIPSGGRVRK